MVSLREIRATPGFELVNLTQVPPWRFACRYTYPWASRPAPTVDGPYQVIPGVETVTMTPGGPRLRKPALATCTVSTPVVRVLKATPPAATFVTDWYAPAGIWMSNESTCPP